MTKANMIKEIQAKEAALWLAIAEYDNQNAPVDGSRDSHLEWDINDAGHCRKLHAWAAVHDLMETMGIEPDWDLWERKAAYELSDDLFTRRQAARGIFYDDRGSEIIRAF